MNVDTIKQQMTIARAAYNNGTVDRVTMDKAFDTIEKELAVAPKPAAPAVGAARPLSESFQRQPPANPVPEQVGKPFVPGGTVTPPHSAGGTMTPTF